MQSVAMLLHTGPPSIVGSWTMASHQHHHHGRVDGSVVISVVLVVIVGRGHVTCGETYE